MPGPSLCTGSADAPLDEQTLSVFKILDSTLAFQLSFAQLRSTTPTLLRGA
ncbi:hypothetical protein M407DRAFT_25369 [Tulasnella calospora MUT 4182]|uniref:Uncharacterized protein n=1 Tax=Tulasnella calospora MUT 4182 TaxID=1051891 RepID=A0A0C3Q6Y9_9AGAM|nr:hypothetical protein M407DRAFT_25369 [Tulasnella calospora MUT 4182]